MSNLVSCKRCNGKGFGPWRTDFGRCFACDGTGQVDPNPQIEVSTARYIPSLRGRRRGHKTNLEVTFSTEVTRRGLSVLQRFQAMHITGTDRDGQPYDKWLRGEAVCQAAYDRLVQSDDVIPAY